MPADPLEIAIRAEEAAKEAHRRLNRMNGSIDGLRTDISVARREAAEQTGQILRRLDREDGGEAVSRGLIDSRRFLISTIVLVLTSSVVSLLLTLALRSH